MHRKVVSFILLCLAVLAAPVYDCRNLCLDGGGIRLAPAGRSLCRIGFTEESAGYKVANFENKLLFVNDKYLGEPCLVISRKADGKGTDTAWELKTRRFAVTAGEAFTLAVRASGDVDMRATKGHKDKYLTVVRWYDRNGAVLPDADYKYNFNSQFSFWGDTYNRGMVPAGAVTAEIMMGADNPNIMPGQQLRIARLEFMQGGGCCPNGAFVSRCFRYEPGARLLWEADCPAGAKVCLQLSAAAEKDGSAGPWSDFVGLDGTVGTAFERSGMAIPTLVVGQAWLRYKATLMADGSQTPRLKSVTVGAARDDSYVYGGNTSAGPFMERVSPSPSLDARQPLQFRFIGDNPVDAVHMSFAIDGVDCKAGLTWDSQGLFTYRPLKEWQPLPMETSPEKWSFTTGKSALLREPLQDGTHKGVRIHSELTQGDTFFTMISGYLAVQPGASCTLTFSERSNQNMKGQIGKSRVVWFDRNLKTVGNASPFRHATEAADWTMVELVCRAPADACIAQIVMHLDSPNLYQGAWLDIADVELRDAADKLAREAFNLHYAHATGHDLNGMAFDETIAFLIGEKVPDCGGRTTMRDDGFMLVDGKPFFPLGIGGLSKKAFNDNSYEKALRDLQAAGFNMAYVYAQGDALVEFLDIADRLGMYSSVRAFNDPVSTVLRFRNHKSVFTWAIGDDTSAHIPAAKERLLHNICHALDGTRVTSQADAIVGNNYAPYVHATDVFRAELYPIRAVEAVPAELPEVISDLQTVFANVAEAGSPVKSIWGIAQYFDGWKAWKRFPTYDELHAMSWLIIIHGAHGLTWYTYGGTGDNHGVTSTPERWDSICRVVGEIASLQHELIARHASVQPTVEIVEGKALDALQHPAVSCLLKANDGGRLLLAANSSYAAVKAKFRLPQAYSQAVLPFEERAMSISGQEFTDTFAPLEVHVYRLR